MRSTSSRSCAGCRRTRPNTTSKPKLSHATAYAVFRMHHWNPQVRPGTLAIATGQRHAARAWETTTSADKYGILHIEAAAQHQRATQAALMGVMPLREIGLDVVSASGTRLIIPRHATATWFGRQVQSYLVLGVVFMVANPTSTGMARNSVSTVRVSLVIFQRLNISHVRHWLCNRFGAYGLGAGVPMLYMASHMTLPPIGSIQHCGRDTTAILFAQCCLS